MAMTWSDLKEESEAQREAEPHPDPVPEPEPVEDSAADDSWVSFHELLSGAAEQVWLESEQADGDDLLDSAAEDELDDDERTRLERLDRRYAFAQWFFLVLGFISMAAIVLGVIWWIGM